MKTKFKGARLQSYKLTPIGDELSALITPDENSIYIATLASNLSKHFKVETITASR